MGKSHINNHQNSCIQEARLSKLEASLSSIQESIKDIKDLLQSSIRADERIHALQGDALDQEKRIRKLETAQATSRWIERLVWIVVAAYFGYLFKGAL